MSKAWRDRQIVDYEPTGNEQAWSGELDSQYLDSDYPGPKENYHADSENVSGFSHAVVTIKDALQYEQSESYSAPYIQGYPALTMSVGSTGVVDSSNVDAHYFDGGSAVIRRMHVDMSGPVATSDHNSLLGILYAMQESNAYFPNEVSQVDMIRAV